MIDFSNFYAGLGQLGLEPYKEQFQTVIETNLLPSANSKLKGWYDLLDRLPDLAAAPLGMEYGSVQIGNPAVCSDVQRQELVKILLQLKPWRKGPFDLFGVKIDTEWRSNLKWERLQPHLPSLEGHRVLDVGSGNGYYSLRMYQQGAGTVLGIDPTLLFLVQFQVFKRYLLDPAVHVLPMSLEQFPGDTKAFDTVFSMGVLYHRRSPFDHLLALKDCLRPGGQLVLETLVVDGDDRTVLVPRSRYAKMRNVWFIPAAKVLEDWLVRCGFNSIRCVDVCQTTIDEQRATQWMEFESLADFLNPNDTRLTIEGYPAPKRAVLIAQL